jgi:hypothetical protein
MIAAARSVARSFGQDVGAVAAHRHLAGPGRELGQIVARKES